MWVGMDGVVLGVWVFVEGGVFGYFDYGEGVGEWVFYWGYDN